MIYIPYLCKRNLKPPSPSKPHNLPLTNLPLSRPWFYYVVISVLDVLGNYLVVLSFNLTSLTSVSLIDCTTIPFVMMFSGPILKRTFSRMQIAGERGGGTRREERHMKSNRFIRRQPRNKRIYVLDSPPPLTPPSLPPSAALICISGIGLVILSDALYPMPTTTTTSDSVNSRIIGDVLALLGSVVYALNNVLCEKYVQVDRPEYLGMLGLFAAAIAGIEVAAFEGEEVQGFFKNGGADGCEGGTPGWLLVGYVASITAFYIRMTKFVQTR